MKKLLIFIVFLFLLIGGAYFWWSNNISAVQPGSARTKIFVVTQGEGTRIIADNLKQAGLIKDPIAFYLLIKQMGAEGKLQAGEFTLGPGMNDAEIVKKLQLGTFDMQITIPEGKRAEEIADILMQNFPNYTPEWRSQLNAHEGYLFPDTYSLPRNSTFDQILSATQSNFDKKYVQIPDGRKNSLTKEEIVIVASLIEREARYQEDKPLVASVIFNRLAEGMPLQLDATVQYALGYSVTKKTWWKNDLTSDDLAISSPYNTYVNTGLPPTPISNPGLDSLSAVVHAPATGYFYYVSDKSGHIHYAKTLAEHNANIQKYSVGN